LLAPTILAQMGHRAAGRWSLNRRFLNSRMPLRPKPHALLEALAR
jgi:hypothetical protein